MVGKRSKGDGKLKKLLKENKLLRQKVAKMSELIGSDKNLKQMKNEFNECFTDTKLILETLEDHVQKSVLTEIVGAEQAAILDPVLMGGLSETKHEHLKMNRLNSLTMGQFERDFFQEIKT